MTQQLLETFSSKSLYIYIKDSEAQVNRTKILFKLSCIDASLNLNKTRIGRGRTLEKRKRIGGESKKTA